MDLFEFIRIDPKAVKVHLACWNGVEDPLDVYFDGSFQDWQGSQTKRNFQRKYIISLIRYPGDNLWIFVGVYESKGIVKIDAKGIIYYETMLTDIAHEFIGRLIVYHVRKGRNSYPYGENVLGTARLHSIMAEPLVFSDFTTYKEVLLTRQKLELLFEHQYPSWRSALSSVAGIYLISDRNNGKLYVGQACGQGGIWGRWSTYADNYHGENAKLKELYKAKGSAGFDLFEYSILETCDIDALPEHVYALESRWKSKLLSKDFGYNDN